MDRQIVLHDTDAGGIGIVDVNEFPHAVRIVNSGTMVCNLDVTPAAMRIEGDEEIDGAVAAIFVIVALALSRLGRNRLTYLADQLDGGLVETDQRPLGIGRLGVEIEHVLHAGDVFAVDTGNAPHLPAPWLEVVIGQPAAHGLARQAVVISKLDHCVGQQRQCPALAASGWLGACRRHQQGFFLACQLAFRARTRLLAQGSLQIAFHKAALGPADGGKADPDGTDNLRVATAGIGRQQNLRPLEFAGGMFAATEHRRQFVSLGLAQFDPITYIHASPPCRRPGRIQR